MTLLRLFGETDAYEREIIRLQALDDEVPTPNVSKASESGGKDTQDIISDRDTDIEQEDPDEDENQSDASSATSRFLYFYVGDGTKWKKACPKATCSNKAANYRYPIAWCSCSCKKSKHASAISVGCCLLKKIGDSCRKYQFVYTNHSTKIQE